ncbi:hypothetical protein BN975_05122 [Mycolicibacterium farcinogenes]|nr:hypothetical protein BN975_05122 [Mycolicibacterium farcinogenes]
MGQCALRPFVTQCGELTFGRLGAHPGTDADGWLAHRFQQRLVEELGVQPGHAHALAFEFLAQHARRVVAAVGAHVRGAGQPAVRLVVAVVGQHVGALEPLQLQPVFEQPQEFIRGGHVGGVVATDVAALAQGRQRVDGGRHMQRVVVASVHQLQELDGEFDVA